MHIAEVARENHHYQAVVVAAGPAGLTVMNDLADAGIDALGLEMDIHGGGRAWVDPGGIPRLASLIHGTHSELHHLAELSGAEVVPLTEDEGILAGLPKIEPFLPFLPKPFLHESTADYLLRLGLTGDLMPDKFKYLQHDDEPQSASFQVKWLQWSYDKYGEMYADNDSMVDFGIIMRHLAEGLNIQYGARAEVINWGDNPSVTFRLGNSRRTVHCDTVVCAVPNANYLDGSIIFEPELPKDKQKLSRYLGQASVAKIVARFEQTRMPVLPDGRNYLLAIPENPSEWWFDGTYFYGWACGDNARKLLSMPTEKAIREGLNSLSRVLRKKLPEVVYAEMVRRPNNAFTFARPGAPANVHEELGLPVGNLIFAGDHTNRDPAITNAARESGHIAAEEVEKLLLAA